MAQVETPEGRPPDWHSGADETAKTTDRTQVAKVGTRKMNIEDMTHEELANEAIRKGRAHNDDALVEAGRELLTLVENEKASGEQAITVIDLLRACRN